MHRPGCRLRPDAGLQTVHSHGVDDGGDQANHRRGGQQQDEYRGDRDTPPLASGARAPSRPLATKNATTLITVAQTQPRRRCISRTAAATAGSEGVAAESGDFTGLT
jgi:hypothetical protein